MAESVASKLADASRAASPLHPYYPTEAEIVGYLANTMSVPVLLTSFAAGTGAIFAVTYILVKKVRPNLSAGDLSAILWFTMCGFIHFFFEGYFAYNFRSMAPRNDLFGQLWKEYAYSDSRYLTQNAFVLCMETITAAFWGPLSFLSAALIAYDHPLRYPLQIIVSLGQLYGDVLYYATSMFDEAILGVRYYRPEPYYFWAYFVFMNAFWIVIPAGLIWQAVRESVGAFRVAKEVGNRKAYTNGSAKKMR